MFVERFEEQSVPQKSTIILPARVLGNPVPEVTWLFNNNPLEPSDRISLSYDGENIELVIKNASPETDSGDYKCIASNPIGKASHGARILVEVDKVKFTKKLKKTVTIEEMDEVILECETSHIVSTKWYHNDKEISGMDHRVIAQEGKSHKLIIKTTAIRDKGTYKCTVKDQETHTTLEVTERKPEFVRRLQDFEVKEREIAILEVEISSQVADVAWYKDGEKLTEENKNLKFVKEGTVRKLFIRQTSLHDEGEYTCALKDDECTAEVIIVEGPPEIIVRMEDLTIAKGEKASFEIELTKGDALVKWFKNGKELIFSDHVQLSIDGKRQKLKIYKSEMEDAGEYSCEVGEQISRAVLTVEEPIVDFIIRLPEVTLVTKTNDATFVVELSLPNIDVKWYKNGKEITPSTKYVIVKDENVRKLIVLNAQDDDVAEYSCVACNVKTTSTLKVEDIQIPPTISLNDNDRVYKVKEEEDVTFNIKFTASPKPEVEWYTNNKLIKKSPRVVKKVGDQSASLTIRKIVDDDVGDYTVKLKNDSGDVEASLKLIIMSKYFYIFLFKYSETNFYLSQNVHHHQVNQNPLKQQMIH